MSTERDYWIRARCSLQGAQHHLDDLCGELATIATATDPARKLPEYEQAFKLRQAAERLEAVLTKRKLPS